MISMKIEFNNDKIIIYLYQIKLNFDNLNTLNSDIKKILIKLIDKYNVNLFGYSKVNIYHNNKYGSILEIEKIYNNDEFNVSTIDLRIIVYRNVPMFLEFDDFYFVKKPKHLIMKNNKYYIDINDINNIIKYIEFGKIKYKENS